MKTSLFVALCFSALLIGRVVSLSCGSAQCGSSDACCNDVNLGFRCYDPTTYDCVDGSHLCGKGLHACGSACYDPSQYSCSNGQLVQGASSQESSSQESSSQESSSSSQPSSSCGAGLQACGSACYDPTTYSCAPSGDLYQGGTAPALFCNSFNLNPCAQGQECCDDECFDPSTQVCLNSVLCPTGQTLCGYDLCYDPNTQECCNDKIFAKGTSVCSESGASCCSCSCNVDGGAESYIVPSGQCHSQYIIDNIGYLPCVNEEYGGGCGENCVESCGPYPTIANYCFSDEFGCTGHFICGGGNFTCTSSASSECQATVKNTGSTTTQVISGAPQFQALSPDYVGKVCCWCAGDNGRWSENLPVPSYNDCQPSYVNLTLSNGPYHCRVWSAFTSADSFCGGPQ